MKTRNFALIIAICQLLFVYGCFNFNYGSENGLIYPCDASGECLSGFKCIKSSLSGFTNGECAPLCKSDKDCHNGRTCLDGLCRADSHSDSNSDSNTDSVRCENPKMTGENCDIEIKCNVEHGELDTNTGHCLPESCPHFTGLDCNECKSQFTGESCDKCKPGYGGKECNTHCENPKMTGENCDKCANGMAGENCDEPACLHGHIDSSGNCICEDHWSGENCSLCTTGGWKGEKCDEYSCENGDPDPDTGWCKEGSCIGHFTGPDCSKCPPPFTGKNCNQCNTDIAYGADCTPYGSVEDLKHNTYKTFKILNLEWMAENLRYVNDESDTLGTDYFFVAKNPGYYIPQVYGLLYPWDKANQYCHDLGNGWHLPTKAEFDQLRLAAYNGAESDYNTYNQQSENLRATSWEYGRNTLGFGALPTGYCYSGDDCYASTTVGATFWSSDSTVDDGITKYYYLSLLIDYYKTGAPRPIINAGTSKYFLSVRCVRNAPNQ